MGDSLTELVYHLLVTTVTGQLHVAGLALGFAYMASFCIVGLGSLGDIRTSSMLTLRRRSSRSCDECQGQGERKRTY